MESKSQYSHFIWFKSECGAHNNHWKLNNTYIIETRMKLIEIILDFIDVFILQMTCVLYELPDTFAWCRCHRYNNVMFG